MSKKLFLCLIILIFTTLLLHVVYATDIATPYTLTSNTSVEDNTINTLDLNAEEENISISTDISDSSLNSEFSTPTTITTTTDYDDSSELSISDIINIILISVGVVLILLGIAIIIKLK